jgi:hypothetical protein
MKNLHRCYEVVLQNTAKGGITANDIAKEMEMHKTVVHHLLNTLKALGKVEDQHGVWHVRPDKQAPHLEKEIVIELPIPKDQWRQIAFFEAQAKEFERLKMPLAEDVRILLEKFRETRTIRITGKNVDDIDLEKIGNLIQQANQKSSFYSLRGLFKTFKKPRQQSPKSSET